VIVYAVRKWHPPVICLVDLPTQIAIRQFDELAELIGGERRAYEQILHKLVAFYLRWT
jgi:hypothetical protein